MNASLKVVATTEWEQLLDQSVIEKFWRKVDRRAESECWPWLGGKNYSGYGRFYVPATRFHPPAHRVSLFLAQGPLDPTLVVDHLCQNPPCVNPAHLELVTPLENARRGKSRMKTHCPWGHEYSPENTYYNPKNERLCIACDQRRHGLAAARSSAPLAPIDPGVIYGSRWGHHYHRRSNCCIRGGALLTEITADQARTQHLQRCERCWTPDPTQPSKGDNRER